MDNKKLLYEKIDILNLSFPVIFHYDCVNAEDRFTRHWHEKMEFLYFVEGEGEVICNGKEIPVNPGVLTVINSNEIHEVIAISGKLKYYCIIIDNLLFKAMHTDICEARYINPIYQNLIIFENRIEKDNDINLCIDNIVKEFNLKSLGYELSIKSYIFRLMVILLRKHTYTTITPNEYNTRVKNLDKINSILKYIEKNYNRNIKVEDLCRMAKLSKYYFLHLFKRIMGKPVIDYINYIRINKAEEMLLNSDANITETAFECGFNDANYFSRLFKKYKKMSPSQVKKDPYSK